jgi:cytochrome P450
MKAGQRVMLLLQSANRDEREFADAERFDVRRVMSRHVGFGQGTHFCIGIHLARTTGVALLRGLLDHCPVFTVDLSGAERPPSEFQIGWTRMPIVVPAP